MKREFAIATIGAAHYGVRDFPDGRPGLWFGIEWEGGWGALIAFEHDEAEKFLMDNRVYDIAFLSSQLCEICIEGTGAGPVRFVRLLKPEAVSL